MPPKKRGLIGKKVKKGKKKKKVETEDGSVPPAAAAVPPTARRTRVPPSNEADEDLISAALQTLNEEPSTLQMNSRKHAIAYFFVVVRKTQSSGCKRRTSTSAGSYL
jgi:hypothetical protein